MTQNKNQNTQNDLSNRGTGSLDKDKQREIANEGSRNSQNTKNQQNKK